LAAAVVGTPKTVHFQSVLPCLVLVVILGRNKFKCSTTSNFRESDLHETSVWRRKITPKKTQKSGLPGGARGSRGRAAISDDAERRRKIDTSDGMLTF
jgi:hypothetical protein